MIKDIEYFLKKTFFSQKFLLKRKLERQIKNNYENELSIIKEFKDKDKIAIDVGVYRGIYSFQLSKYFKKVVSFEPNPLIFNDLKNNLEKIISNIQIFNYALSNEDGVTKLKIPNRGKSIFNKNYEELFKLGAASIHQSNNLGNYQSFDVSKKKLDDIINRSEKVGFIKIDVEGHENEVIDGAKKVINENKPVLLVEIEEKHTNKPLDISVNRIKKLGYECYQLDENKLIKFKIENHSIKRNNFIFISV